MSGDRKVKGVEMTVGQRLFQMIQLGHQRQPFCCHFSLHRYTGSFCWWRGRAEAPHFLHEELNTSNHFTERSGGGLSQSLCLLLPCYLRVEELLLQHFIPRAEFDEEGVQATCCLLVDEW